VRSHELARLLLARRDNDVMVQMAIDDDAEETGNPDLHDMAYVNVQAVGYDPVTDRVMILTEEHSGPSWGE
jgi:hypothetical protein